VTAVTGFECVNTGEGSSYPGAVFACHTAIAAPIAAGSVIVVRAYKSADNSTPVTMKDTQGNTYTQIQSLVNTPGGVGDEWKYVFLAQNVAALPTAGVDLYTSAATPTNSPTLTFTSTTGVSVGMTVTAYGLAWGTTVTGVTSTTVTLSTPSTSSMVTNYKVTFGDCIYFNLLTGAGGGTDYVGYYATVVTGGLVAIPYGGAGYSAIFQNPTPITSTTATGNVTSGPLGPFTGSVLVLGDSFNVTDSGSAPYYPAQDNLTLLANYFQYASAGNANLATCGYGTFSSPSSIAALFSSQSPGATGDTYMSDIVVLQLAGSGGGAALASALTAPDAISGTLTTSITMAAALTSVASIAGTLGSAVNPLPSAWLTAPCTISGSLTPGQAALASALQAPCALRGQLTNYASVVLSNAPWYGPGSVYDPNYWEDAAPVPGTTLWYDPTYLIVLATGAVISTQNPVTALMFFQDGSETGSGWAQGTYSLTPGEVSYLHAPCTITGSLTTLPNVFSTGLTNPCTISGTLTTGIALTAGISAPSALSATLSTGIALTSALNAPCTLSASISQASQLAGGMTATVSVTGSLSTSIRLAASLGAPALIQGALNAGPAWRATLSAPSTIQGALTAQTRFASALQAPASVRGTITTAIQLAQSLYAPVTMRGSLTTNFALAAGLSSKATITGTLGSVALFGSTRTAPCSIRGTLTVGAGLAANLQAPCTITPSLFAQAQFACNMTAPCTIDPYLRTQASPIGIYKGDPTMTVGAPFQDQPTVLTFGPTQQDVVSFDFAPILPPGVTLQGVASFSVENSAGSDATPANILVGVGSFDPTLTQVLVPVNAANGMLNNDYYIICTCATTNPQIVLDRFALVQIRG